jgi:hypothetical protein
MVFDGCGSGADSHFSSTYFKLCALSACKKYNWHKDSLITIVDNILLLTVLNADKHKIENARVFDYLSTVCITVIDNNTNESYSKILGDGTIMINNEIVLDVNPPNNAPIYPITYASDFASAIHHIHVAPSLKINIEKTLILSTDGITSFKNKISKTSYTDKVLELVSMPLKLVDAALQRKLNILSKDAVNFDDVTLVRFDVPLKIPTP